MRPGDVRPRLYLACDPVELVALGHLKVVPGLEAQPPSGVAAEVPGEAQGRVGGDRALAGGDREQAVVGHVQRTGQMPGGQRKRLHEVLQQDLARMDRRHPGRTRSIDIREVDQPGLQLLARDGHPFLHSVVVTEPDIVAVPILPAEANAPLPADPDRPLALPVSAQPFEAMAGNCRQLLQPLGVVDLVQLRPGPLLQIAMKIMKVDAREDARGALVGEGPDHGWYIARTTTLVKGACAQKRGPT